MLEQRIAENRAAFEPAIGSTLTRYSTAELLSVDGTWGAWLDLPIRLEWGADGLIAVSCSKFDELWLRTDDENGYDLHAEKPAGMFVRCC